MKIFNIEFAPLNVPLERRLQTLIVTVTFITFFVGEIVCCALIILSVLLGILFGFGWMQLFITIYLLFIYYDSDVHKRGGRCKRKLLFHKKNKWWKYFCDYFPTKIVKTVDLDCSRNYIFCPFPHGMLPLGTGFSLVTNGSNCYTIFPGLDFRSVTLNVHFYVPFFRELMLSLGCCGNSKESLEYLLTTKPSESIDENDSKQGRGIILYVGGTDEAFKSQPGTYNLVLKRKKGFVKIALQHGTPLVPVFSFGENDYYDQIFLPEGSLIKKFQDLVISVVGFCPTPINGRGLFQYSYGMTPRRNPINIVVGAPLEIPRIENPTSAEIDEYHSKFIDKLIDLFETHKSKYIKNHENASLIFDD